MKLYWKDLLNEERRRKSNKHPNDNRNEFERDYDRSIYSPYFRRLQDKAQVFPLEQDDFVRTRLTHSIEVSSIGRSFGIEIAKTLLDNGLIKQQEIDLRKTSAILSTACLLHDIGNPPFGHFGEQSIRMWFKEWFNNQDRLKESKPNECLINNLTKEQKNDFINFEGNAQALRILTYLNCIDDENGLNLTFGTLGSLIKYPTDSSNINEDIKSKSKCGFFQSEKKVFEEIQEKCKLYCSRHPLAIIMEAADDIAWSIIDIEDALRKETMQFEEFIEFMQENLEIINKNKRWDNFLQDSKNNTKWGFVRSYNIAMQKLRIRIIGDMFRACVDSFTRNYNDIMKGVFNEPLIKYSDEKDLHSLLCKFARKHIYKNRAILAMEVLGCEVIDCLLNFIVPHILGSKTDNIKTYEGKIYHLIGPTLRKQFEIFSNKTTYDKLLLATDYISSLTDTYALNLYQKWSGIKLRT
ncbi:MAG: dNTP triphosphohydrolase [Ignavibacteriae bacterium]|nr:MAG: dNTP triphosphohydrolase [Ignavibacteriota bacterium]